MTVLTSHQGNVDAAFQELNKAQLKPFLMRIWGQAGPGGDVTSGQDIPKEPNGKSFKVLPKFVHVLASW